MFVAPPSSTSQSIRSQPAFRGSGGGHTNAPRVMQIITRMNVGGPAAHVTMVGRVLSEDGFEPVLVHGRLGPGESRADDSPAGTAGRAVFIQSLGPRVSPMADLAAFVHLLRLVWRLRPAVVHTHTSKAGALGRFAAAACNAVRPRSARSLIVHTFHGNVMSGYYGRLGSAAVRFIERRLAAVTDRIIAISPQQLEELTGRFAIADRGKVVEIPLGVDLEALECPGSRRDTGRARLGLAPEDVAFLYAGRLVPVKDLSALIEAFARVVGRVPQARLIIAGGGDCRAALEVRAGCPDVRGRVTFIGWCDDMAALYGASDVGVLASRNEGTPLFLIEALAAGLPVVATAVGGVADLVRHEVTGLLVPPGRPDDLAAAMVRFATDAAARRRFGRAARQEVLASDRFRPERLRRELARVYCAGLADVRGSAAYADGGALITLPTRAENAGAGGRSR